ncbi:MAG: ferritin family protein [Candidatus Diapherotrites archaeon]|nr:ferritin family protein [Candidatus Diapherotrites archaeon]
MGEEIIKKLIDIPNSEVEEISQAVVIAKNEEAKARDFYQKSADNTQDPEVKKAFEFLAKEEIEHFNALIAVETTLAGRGKFAVITEEGLKHLEKPDVYPSKPLKGKDLESNSELSALLFAMRAERKAELFYRTQAKKTSVKEVKEFWETLADFEAGHFQYLDGIFETWTDTQDFIMG